MPAPRPSRTSGLTTVVTERYRCHGLLVMQTPQAGDLSTLSPAPRLPPGRSERVDEPSPQTEQLRTPPTPPPPPPRCPVLLLAPAPPAWSSQSLLLIPTLGSLDAGTFKGQSHTFSTAGPLAAPSAQQRLITANTGGGTGQPHLRATTGGRRSLRTPALQKRRRRFTQVGQLGANHSARRQQRRHSDSGYRPHQHVSPRH